MAQLRTTVTISHACAAAGGRSAIFALRLTPENVYSGKCPACGVELERDLTLAVDALAGRINADGPVK